MRLNAKTYVIAALLSVTAIGLSVEARAQDTSPAPPAAATPSTVSTPDPAAPPATSTPVVAPVTGASATAAPPDSAATSTATASSPAAAPPASSSPTATATSSPGAAPAAATTSDGSPATAAAPSDGTPAATDAPPATTVPATNATMLPPELSVTSMFLHADSVVQAVLVGLMLASIATWTVLLAKGIELIAANRRLHKAVAVAEDEHSVAALKMRTARRGDPTVLMIEAAILEQTHSAGGPHDGIRERTASRLQRIEVRLVRRMRHGTGILATIGATAPFVGLFGTVWGIMNSFIGISKLQTTNLAVVAPGIAEALLATAAGLIAAIPAVVIYNLFARGIAGYRAGLGDLAAAVERLVSRDLDLRRPPLRSAAE